MALPPSGPITFNNINTELSNASGTTISLNDTSVRKMFNINAGAIDLNTGRGLGVVSSNLEINLDAKNASSYNGSGTTWYGSCELNEETVTKFWDVIDSVLTQNHISSTEFIRAIRAVQPDGTIYGEVSPTQ